MDPTRIGLFSLAEHRLAWADQRQRVLAQNIANVATPAFQPSDLPAFAQTLDRVAPVALVRTAPYDLGGTAGTEPYRPRKEADAHGPDGNGVALDDQLSKVADTATAQSLTMAIYKKYLTMFGIALGSTAT